MIVVNYVTFLKTNSLVIYYTYLTYLDLPILTFLTIVKPW